jgi:hypothetical protein
MKTMSNTTPAVIVRPSELKMAPILFSSSYDGLAAKKE